MYHSNLPSFTTINSDSEHALRVRLTQTKATHAKQNPNQNIYHNNCTNFDSTHAPQIHLTKNQLAPAQQFYTLNLNTPNHSISYYDFDSRDCSTNNKLTLAWHDPHLFNQPYISHNSNALFATHTNNHQIKSKLASHSTNTINTPLQIEPQIALFETQNTGKVSFAYQNQHQFTELSHFNLSITNKAQIPSLICTQMSRTLNKSRAQLVNNKKSLFAQTQSEIQ